MLSSQDFYMSSFFIKTGKIHHCKKLSRKFYTRTANRVAAGGTAKMVESSELTTFAKVCVLVCMVKTVNLTNLYLRQVDRFPSGPARYRWTNLILNFTCRPKHPVTELFCLFNLRYFGRLQWYQTWRSWYLGDNEDDKQPTLSETFHNKKHLN